MSKLARFLHWATNWGFGLYFGKNPWDREENARDALREIVVKLGDQTLSGLGRDIRDIAIKGLR